MEELLVGSSVLILFIILVRAVMGRRISFRMRYALWLIVVLRLAWPFALPGSPVSIMNYVPSLRAFLEGEKESPIQDYFDGMENMTVEENSGGKNLQNVGIPQSAMNAQDVTNPQNAINAQDTMNLQENGNFKDRWQTQGSSILQNDEMTHLTKTAALKNTVLTIWLIGAILMVLYLLIINSLLYWQLRRTRVLVNAAEQVKKGRTLSVYCCGKLTSPCLFGVWHPAIYLNDTALANEKDHSFTLAHEKQHYCHKDHIWSLVRLVCLTVYWYHPLVWLAAVLSARDCEFACDEGVTAQITEEECTEYGRSLLNQVFVKRGRMCLMASTSMSGNARQLKKRLLAITHKKKPCAWAVFLTAGMLLLITGCTFTEETDRGADAVANAKEDGTDGIAAKDTAERIREELLEFVENTKAQTVLQAYTMFTDGCHGWALTVDHRILYTENGPGQFSLVDSLPDAKANVEGDGQAEFLEGTQVASCFLDEEHAYFAGLSADSKEVILMRETIKKERTEGDEDGCVQVERHSTRIPLKEYLTGDIYVNFSDSEHGYLLVLDTPALGLMTKHLYRTVDGGESFSFVADLSGEITGYPTGMSFCGEEIGYIATTYHGEENYLYCTTDGGETWESLSLPIRTEAVYVDGFAPVFYGKDTVQAALVLKTVGEEVQYILYLNNHVTETPDSWVPIWILPYDGVRGYSFTETASYFIDEVGILHEWRKEFP